MQAFFGAFVPLANWYASSLWGSISVTSARHCRMNSTSVAGKKLVSIKSFTARLYRDSAAFFRTLWWRLTELVGSCFSGDSEDIDDPFVDLVQQDPFAAGRFIRIVMALSVLSSSIVCASGAVFLPLYWNQHAGCKKPLHSWLLLHCVLLLLQLPVRIVFSAKVGHADVRDLEACVISLTSSPAWRFSNVVRHVAYAWSVLGVLWLVNAGDNAPSTGIYKMVVAAIIQAVARAFAAWVSFKFLFTGNETESQPVPLKAGGADPEKVSALPLVRFRNTPADGSATCATSCAVCLSEYQRMDVLRQLPCGHYFHRNCADQWLCRSNRCPLCTRAIDLR